MNKLINRLREQLDDIDQQIVVLSAPIEAAYLEKNVVNRLLHKTYDFCLEDILHLIDVAKALNYKNYSDFELIPDREGYLSIYMDDIETDEEFEQRKHQYVISQNYQRNRQIRELQDNRKLLLERIRSEENRIKSLIPTDEERQFLKEAKRLGYTVTKK